MHIYERSLRKQALFIYVHYPREEIKQTFFYLKYTPLGYIMFVERWMNIMEEIKECCHKTKKRSEKEHKDLLNRLSRIEGQVRGIKRMIDEDAYCIDILTQVSAVNAALNSFNKMLLAEHIKTCVKEDIKAGNEETVDELVKVMQKLMK